MRSRLRVERRAPKEPWTRRRLQVVLVVAVVVALALTVVGMATVVGGRSSSGGGVGRTVSRAAAPASSSAGDRLAAEPMHSATAQDAQPGQLTVQDAADLHVPIGSSEGPAGVATGFPPTPEGALGQLIAIDQQAMQPLSVANAQQVIDAWVMLGGPTGRSWSGVRAVAQLLTSSGMPDGDGSLTLELRPAMGQIKGTVGRTFVVPCVDFVATVATGSARAERVAVADCQRMAWDHGRWRIAAGPEPAPAPSIWPGTRASYAAGYRWLVSSA